MNPFSTDSATTNFRENYDRWRFAQLICIVLMGVLGGVFLLELIMPGPTDDSVTTVDPVEPALPDADSLNQFLEKERNKSLESVKNIRTGLFKPGSRLKDKPMAEKTIQRIRSQLKLRCVMQMNGEPVAYIHIKGMGLKRCRFGDNVEDLFTVVKIDEKYVEMKIIGHKVLLRF